MLFPDGPGPGQRWPDSVPTLIDHPVVLRAHRSDDLPRLVEMCNDPEFARWTTTPHPYGAADGHAFLSMLVPREVDAGRAMLWAVEAPPTPDGAPEFCGTIEIRLLDGQRGEIAFGLHPDARGRGILRSAGRLALDWAYDVLGLQAVVWSAKVGNWASRHAAAALGFGFEGVRRAHRDQRGTLVDHWVATALATDPRRSVAPPRQPVLTGERVVLRPFEDDDADRIVEACADPVSQHWLGALPRGYRREHALEFVEDCRETAATLTDWTWCITARGDDRCVGALSLFRLRDRSGAGELGYWAHPAARGRGLISDAARTVADFTLGIGRDAPRFHRTVMVRAAAENLRSQAVAQNTGAGLVGRLPQAEQLGDGSWTDLLVFIRTR
ncbi:MAG TPA: GNAT family N-acetyltransferase [Propionibacterium sp.]|nr:GNAT family N-acetyltransferase [Propionibacterium sp.]